MKVAIYSRVSTSHQDDEAQFDELRSLCERSGWELAGSYREKVSGTKASEERAELKRLIEDAKRRRFEKVVVWSIDRLARSMRHLIGTLAELQDCRVHIFSYKQAIDTETPTGAMLFQFLGIFAEFENAIRRERQALGITRAKARGVRFGRKPIPPSKEREIVALRRQGMGINRIGRTLGVGTGAIYRALDKAGLGTTRLGT